MAYKLPVEFVELNEKVKEFNLSFDRSSVIPSHRYLLLQGSRVKGYSLSIFEGKAGSGRFIHTLINGNKQTIENTLWLLNGLKIARLK
jgi:hypothetical protein